MKDWKALIKHFYAQNGGIEEIWVGEPATNQSISEFETSLGLKVSEEFRSLYTQFDGTNEISDDSHESHFGFVPIQRLPSFIEDVRRSFRDKHPTEAAQFFPFFDRGGGSFLGFMYSDEDGLDSELFLFWLGGERGETVFLLPCEDSIESFLLCEDTQSEQAVAPNRSLPPTLNPASSVRGSEDF